MGIERLKKDEIQIQRVQMEKKPIKIESPEARFEPYYKKLKEKLSAEKNILDKIQAFAGLALLFSSRREETRAVTPWITDPNFWISLNILVRNIERSSVSFGYSLYFLSCLKMAAPHEFSTACREYAWRSLFENQVPLLGSIASMHHLIAFPDRRSPDLIQSIDREFKLIGDLSRGDVLFFRVIDSVRFDSIISAQARKEMIEELANYIENVLRNDFSGTGVETNMELLSILSAKRIINTDDEFRLIMPKDEPEMPVGVPPIPVRRNF